MPINPRNAQGANGRFSAQERFWAKVSGGDVEGCWNWVASIADTGYGQFADRGVRHYAHRFAYQQMVGEIPEGLVLDHLCRNRACVNPWHLDPVTQKINVARSYGARTHCPQGHPYDEANTYVTTRGVRQCRECKRIRDRSRSHR